MIGLGSVAGSQLLRRAQSVGSRKEVEEVRRGRQPAYENASIECGFSCRRSRSSDFSLLTSAFSAQERPTFKASSELVVLHVSVRDRGGRYITGLTRDAFTVIDDARPQTLEMFSADEVPASVGFLIDNSNSMRPSRERVVASAVAFAQNAHPQDEIFVLTFNEAVQEAWRPTIVSEMNTATFASAMSSAIMARGHDRDLRRHRVRPVAARARAGTRARC